MVEYTLKFSNGSVETATEEECKVLEYCSHGSISVQEDYCPIFAVPNPYFFLKRNYFKDFFVWEKNSNAFLQIDCTPDEYILKDKKNSINLFRYLIESYLDYVAVCYNYEDIRDAISFVNSGVDAWKEEALAFNSWRDETLKLMYKNIKNYIVSNHTLPKTIDEFKDQSEYIPLGLSKPSYNDEDMPDKEYYKYSHDSFNEISNYDISEIYKFIGKEKILNQALKRSLE